MGGEAGDDFAGVEGPGSFGVVERRSELQLSAAVLELYVLGVERHRAAVGAAHLDVDNVATGGMGRFECEGDRCRVPECG